MERKQRTIHINTNGRELSTHAVPDVMIFGPEMSFQVPSNYFVMEDDSGMDDTTIHKLASYYGTTLKSLSE